MNGTAEVVESATGYNYMRDGLYGGDKAFYEAQRNAYATASVVGTAVITAGSSAGGICFVAGTLVQTEDGNRPIEEIKTGDQVWAWDEETGKVALKPVLETYINKTYELIHVFVNGEEIVSTPGHPFYSPVKGWTNAVHLRAGDILVLVNGEYVVVEKIQHELLEAPINVYNFNVGGFHTYFVSSSGVLVHNSCHGNSLSTPKPAQGYILRSRTNFEILKYGETTLGFGRYSQKYLDKIDAFIDFVAEGTKAQMHQWQHEMILEYIQVAGQRPPMNHNLF